MALRDIGVLWAGQSNQAGSTLTENGGKGAKFTSEFTGVGEPFRLNSNGGGSCLPRLVDLGLARGVRYTIFNGAIGGASAQFFTGSAGATVNGSVSDPAYFSNTGSSSLTGGTGVPTNEGDVGFDPFSLLSRLRAAKAQYPQISSWIGTFANAESEGGTTATNYRLALESIGRYFAGSGCDAVFLGLSSCGANTASKLDALNVARGAAVATLQGEGLSTFDGANLYEKFGMFAPLYPEKTSPATKVHLTLEGQRVHADLWDAAFKAAGY